MKTVQLLSQLREQGIEVRLLEGSQLKVMAKKGAMTPEIRATLKANKTEIIRFLGRTSKVTVAAEDRIGKRPPNAPCTLSFAQERLWFIETMDPGNIVFLMPEAYRVRGPLDPDRLERSFKTVLQRHEGLRCAFHEKDGQAFAVIEDADHWQLERASLFDLHDPELKKHRVAEQVGEFCLRPFDLKEAPLFRALVIHLAANDHVLCTSIHHIISDGWSARNFLSEWQSAYAALGRGQQPELAPLQVQYPDYAHWQRRHFSPEAMAAERRYWQERLADFKTLTFPTDRPRPAKQQFDGAGHAIQFSPELTKAIRAMAQKQQASTYMVLLALFKTLLLRYCVEADLIVGSSTGNRARRELEPLIGNFVNLLAIRTDGTDDPSFQDWVKRVKESTLESFAHGEFPFEKVVEAVGVERDLSRHPLYQYQLIYLNATETEPKPDPDMLALQPFEDIRNRVSRVDLSLTFLELPEVIVGHFEYATALFDPATIERCGVHLLQVTEAALAAPQTRLSELNLLTVNERAALLSLNRLPQPNLQPPESSQTLHERFASQTRTWPQREALSYEHQHLSYDHLNQRANRLAHALIERGVGPEVRVGLCMERSCELVIAILAILKAGGAYVPLDPTNPDERLAYIAGDAGVAWLLTDREPGPERLAWGHARDRWLDLSQLETLLNHYPTSDPAARALPTNAAYIIYTSGSTGKPKGSLLTHANVVRLFEACQSWYQFGERDTWTMFHSYAFDFSVWELWGALLYGGRLVVVPYWVSRSSEQFYDLLVQEKVTILNQTPSAFGALIQESLNSPSRAHSLRKVTFGGEALNLASLKPWYDHHGHEQTQLVNMYGITETCVHVSYFPIEIAHTTGGFGNLIGERIPDLQMWVLDQRLQLVPYGVAGELFVGGAGLARAYLDRPALTAQRFIPNPYARRPGSRLYRTGDQGRLLTDGSVEYLGRIDNQVKIRGFRIELGEIQAAITASEFVSEALVVTQADKRGDLILVGYLIPSADSSEEKLESLVRKELVRNLPEYMIPSVMIVLDRFPLTNNGKINRKALPEPVFSADSSESDTPETPTEILVASIWESILELDQIGRNGHFFQLGGHSLLATQALSRIRGAFSIELAIKTLFEKPVLRDFAMAIDQAKRGGDGLIEPAIEVGDYEHPSILSFAQERMWFLHRINPESGAYNMPFVFEAPPGVTPNLVQRVLKELAQRHHSLTTRFIKVDGEPRQIAQPDNPPILAVIDLRTTRDSTSEQQRLIQQEVTAPFMMDAPAVRVTMLLLPNEPALIILNMFHIISDGWSMGIFFREFQALCEADLAATENTLPPIALQYSDYARWQRSWLSGEVLDRQLQFWDDQLSEAPSHIELPTDFPRPPIQSFIGNNIPFSLEAGLATRFFEHCRARSVTPFMTGLTAFAVLLNRFSGQGDVLIGTPIANRNREQVEALIGLFVNTLVMRVHLNGSDSFNELLDRVRQTALDAYAHQDLPFEKVVEQVVTQRDASRTPLFQVSYSLAGADHAAKTTELPAMRGFEYPIAKFDLSLNLFHTDTEVEGFINYNVDLFQAATIERLIDHFKHQLESLLTQPEVPLANLASLPAEELGRSRQLWHGDRLPLKPPFLIHEHFESWATKRPHAVALSQDDRELTYAELNQRAEDLAAYLIRQGLQAEQPVGLFLESSFDLMVAIMAILKAGGAYMPLALDYPRDRLAYMVQDSGARWVLSRASLLSEPLGSTQTIDLDAWTADSHGLALIPARPVVIPDQMAVVIYTSGTTGKPKGVALTHRNMVSLTQKDPHLLFEEGDCYTQLGNVSFDIFSIEIWTALLRGGRLHFVPKSALLDSKAFEEELRRGRVNAMLLPTALFNQIAPRRPNLFRNLKSVQFGGEQVDSAAVKAILDAGKPPCLMNAYGPTESSTYVSGYLVQEHDHQATDIPIGQALNHTDLLILDRSMNPVPQGAIGELLIGGIGLARGYLGKPAETASAFVPHPFPYEREPGQRLYRSGDLVRHLTNGQIAFMGRRDQQVKIRGFRIELGEILAAVSHDPAVAEATVQAVTKNGSKVLVAYIVPKPECIEEPNELIATLRTRCGEQLPTYAVPSHFAVLEALPITPNGKLDRKALPAIETLTDAGTRTVVAPSGSVEITIAEIWREVLNLENVGIHDNFFDIGGHSLAMARVQDRLREQLNTDLSILKLFEHTTIASLASFLSEEGSEQTATDQAQSRADAKKRALRRRRNRRS